jgi:hypothetical protein
MVFVKGYYRRNGTYVQSYFRSEPVHNYHKYRYTESLSKWDYEYIPKIHHYESFVNPNARCPVCGERVYFYQSPYGGKVFFDELGPPWTKHPCTTKNKAPNKPLETDIYPSKSPSWERFNWKPFICIMVKSDDEILYQITLESYEELVTCYGVKKDIEIQKGSLVHIREVNNLFFEASILSSNNEENRILLARNRKKIDNRFISGQYDLIIMEKFNTKNIFYNRIGKQYYELLVDDPTTSAVILTYIFFRFFNEKKLINKIIKHPISEKSGMSM